MLPKVRMTIFIVSLKEPCPIIWCGTLFRERPAVVRVKVLKIASPEKRIQ